MNTKLVFGALLLVVVTAAVTSQAVSQEDPIKPPTEAEMMARWQKVMTPGTPHKWLAKLEGDWTVETKMWMGGPGSPEVKTTGTCENEMILGGRFLESEYTGEMMGQPWEGWGLVGYSNYEKRFVSLWADNTGTDVSKFHGHSNRDGKTIRFYGPMNEPMMRMVGKYSRIEWKVVDDDTFVISGYDLGLGEKAKIFEITHKRVKSEKKDDED